jgi:hypothetical protein
LFKSPPEDFETILSNLTHSITTKEQRLADIRERERNAAFSVTLYTLALWGAYVVMYVTGTLPRFLSGRRTATKDQIEAGLKILPLVCGPIFAVTTRRVVQWWFQRKGGAEEEALRKLRKEKRDKIEEFKKKNAYYETRSLLERYDVAPSTPQSALRQRPQGPNGIPSTQATPSNSRPQSVKPNHVIPNNSPNNPFGPGPQQARQPSPSIAQRQWFDKLADAVLGDEPASADPAQTRYALICGNCFSHNGLVKEEQWEIMQYVCPKCGAFNPSPQAKRAQMRLQTASLDSSVGTNSPPTQDSAGPSGSPSRPPQDIAHSKTPSREISPPRAVEQADTSMEKMDVDN